MEDVRGRAGFLLLCGALLAATLFAALPGTAFAQPAFSSSSRPASPMPTAACVVHSLPSFIDQGLEGNASSVADIIEVECAPSDFDGKIKISDTELFDRCGKNLSWSPTFEFKPTEGPTTEATLDDDGNATVVLWGGPGCKPGPSTIVVDDLAFPDETYVATFTVLPPETTPEGVRTLPPREVEDDVFSSVATIIEVEFPVAETKVDINAEQLFARCGKAPHVIWIGPNEKEITRETGRLEGKNALETDDDGNAFVVALGAKSCQPGTVDIEASLEEAESFDSVFTTFEIEAPRPTVEEKPPVEKEPPAFTIEKEQKLSNEATYTKAKLKAKVGDVVDYKITVANTGKVTEKFGPLVDPSCTNIMPAGPTELEPGKAEFFTCEHSLVKADAPLYENVALIEGNKEPKESEKVVVEVEEEHKPPPPPEPKFTIEKEQKLEGGTSFTKEELKAKLDEVVDYRIKVTNTGEVALKFSPLSDEHCTNIKPTGEVELKPTEFKLYTCEHKLTALGHWFNEATITGTSEGKSVTMTSNQVVVDPPPGEAACVAHAASLALRGASGPRLGQYLAWISSRGIRGVTFYLDGHKLKTETASQARRGEFAVTIDTRKLRYGRHTLSARAVPASGGCSPLSRSTVFSRARPGSG